MSITKRIVEILKKEKYEVPDSYVDFIENYTTMWKNWYQGYDVSFHKYNTAGGERKTIERIRSRLNMGKTVAEDWASFLLNEKTYIKLEDDATQKYLVGDDQEQEDGILGKNKFWLNGNRLMERTYALGTSAIVITLSNAVMKDQDIISGDIKLKYIKNPSRIIPLRWENNEIVDCAFITTFTRDKKNYFNAQVHEKVKEGYKITNLEYSYTEYRHKKENFDGVQSMIVPTKLFVILTPNIENNYAEDVPMGISVFSSSIDAFKSADLAYTNFDKDFLLGGKKVFISQDGVAGTMSADGQFTPSADDTAEQSLYVILPEGVSSEHKLFEEFNPAIRVDENTQGIQTALNLISVKCKLGPNFYNFDSESKTVYQNTSSTKANTQALLKSVSKQRIMVTSIIKELVSGVLELAKILGEPVNPEAKVSIQFDDSYFTDDEAERARDLQEVRDGVMTKWEYRMKWYGESEEEAKKVVLELEGNASEEETGFFDA